MDRDAEEWRITKEHGSLLGEVEGMSRRKGKCNVLVEDVENANQHSKPHLQRLETCNDLYGHIPI